MGGPFKYLWAGLALIGAAAVIANLWETGEGVTELGAAWVQAIGSLIAIGVAVALPRLDKRRERREYGEAVHAAATYAHQSIASVWMFAGGAELLGRHEAQLISPSEMIQDLARASAECEAFSLPNAKSVTAVMHLRSMALCCKGASDLLQDRSRMSRETFFERAHRISNFAYHLLILIARDASLPEPPRPQATMRRGVPPHILAEVDTTPERRRC